MEANSPFCSVDYDDALSHKDETQKDELLFTSTSDTSTINSASPSSTSHDNKLDLKHETYSKPQESIQTPFDTNIKFHSIDDIQQFMKSHSTSNGFNFHTSKYKDKAGNYNRGNFKCAFKEQNVPATQKYTCTFGATFCKKMYVKGKKNALKVYTI